MADTSLSGARVARELDRGIRLYGRPETIVSDNGSKLTSRAMPEWQNETGIAWHYIAPGKPQQNGFVESFNGNCGMNALLKTCSTVSPTPARSSGDGSTTTTTVDLFHSWTGWRPQRAARSSM